MKSISTFSIQKLFGLYDYKIAFQDNDLILIGENGSGKTTIMNVLFYFLTKQWEELVSINFNSISIKFIGHAKLLTVTRKEIEEFLSFRHGRLYLFSENQHVQKMSQNLNMISGVLTKIFEDSFILYLPTFRRIENKRQLSEKKTDGLPHLEYNSEEKNYKMLKEFGMDDVHMQNMIYSSRLKDKYVKSLNRLNKQYLNDILVGSYEIDSNILLDFSRDKLVYAVDSIDEHLLSKSNKEKLKSVFNQIANKESVETTDREKILSHYLFLLLNSQVEIQKQRINMSLFVSRCNKYLHGKHLVFDEKLLSYKLINEDGKELQLDALSSGEKQIVSIFSYLCLSSNTSVFVMIDEPELSLSVDWQRTILEDIKECPSCKGLFAVTHSPFVICDTLREYARGMGEFKKS